VAEGDTIHHLARRLGPVLLGRELERVVCPSPRTAASGWPDRLRGRTTDGIEARGKHLLLHLSDGLTLHSHMAMTGSWRVLDGGLWPQRARRAWLCLGVGQRDVVQFGGPTLQVLRTGAVHLHPRLRALGPDICLEAFDAGEAVRRMRRDDPRRGVADALLDQTHVAGIGNLWKVEACWALGIDPWRGLGRCTDDELRALLAWLAPRMQRTARIGTRNRPKEIYGKADRPCPRCRDRILVRRQGDAARPTWWCPSCQR
jgi:endonuclease VIII